MRIPEKPPKLNESLKSIFDLLNDENVLQSIAKYNRKYFHWDKIKYRRSPIDSKKMWMLMKFFRTQQYRLINFSGWNFKYILLPDSEKKLHILDKGTAGQIQTGLDKINTDGKDRYIVSSLMEEAIASSQIEGAATTRKLAKELLRLRKKPKNYSERMIVNGYNTMQKAVKLKDEKITPELILDLHENITRDTLKDKKDEGTFRDNNDVVVGDMMDYENIYHKPPKYNLIKNLMDEFCEFANDDKHNFIHPIIKGIILHFLIGYIHPFNDGNGRTARTIFYWYVLSRDYWLFEYMSVSRVILKSKEKYGLAYMYTESDDNDLTYFINYNLDCIEEALVDMQEYLSRKQSEQLDAIKIVQGSKNINLRQAEILKEIMKYSDKLFSINEIMTTYDVVYQTARSDLLHLEKLKHVKKVKIKNKLFFKKM